MPSPFAWPYGHNVTDDDLSVRASLLAVLSLTIVACVAIAACAYFFGL